MATVAKGRGCTAIVYARNQYGKLKDGASVHM